MPRKKKERIPGRPLGSIDQCNICGKDYTVMSGRQKYCAECREMKNKEEVREYTRDYYYRKKETQPIEASKTKNCEVCGKEFTPAQIVQKYCTPECARKRHNQRQLARYNASETTRHLGSTDKCITCGKEYIVSGGGQKYCAKCREEAEKERGKNINKQGPQAAKCVVCGETFIAARNNQKYCSQTCAHEQNNRNQRIRYHERKGDELKHRDTEHTRCCTICGKRFPCFPSDTTKTCSKTCRKKQNALTRKEKPYKRNNGIIGKGTDLTGKIYNDLKALEPAGQKNRQILWRCECLACGAITEATADQLKSGTKKSCGCRRKEAMAAAQPKALEANIRCDTNIGKIGGAALNRNNTSGYTGVYLNRKTGKYRADIVFRKKHYYLGGAYETAEEAGKVRKQAEQQLHGEFLEWYEEWKRDNPPEENPPAMK